MAGMDEAQEQAQRRVSTALVPVSTGSRTRRVAVLRIAVMASLGLLLGLCWGCLLLVALLNLPPEVVQTAHALGVLVSAPPLPAPSDSFVFMLGFWAVTVPAVLLPASAPLVLMFATISRLHHLVRLPALATLAFVLGSVLTWIGFGAVGALLQWSLHRAGFLDASMSLSNITATGLLLAAAGAYQWTPLKHSSLDHCRSQLSFVLAGWRPGPSGAFKMGIANGLNAIGCGWALMLLLFAAGVMNVAVAAAIAVLLVAEKQLPKGALLACIAGLGLVALGTYVLFP